MQWQVLLKIIQQWDLQDSFYQLYGFVTRCTYRVSIYQKWMINKNAVIMITSAALKLEVRIRYWWVLIKNISKYIKWFIYLWRSSSCSIVNLGHPVSISQFFSQLHTFPGHWALRVRTRTDWISQFDHSMAGVSWACFFETAWHASWKLVALAGKLRLPE